MIKRLKADDHTVRALALLFFVAMLGSCAVNGTHAWLMHGDLGGALAAVSVTTAVIIPVVYILEVEVILRLTRKEITATAWMLLLVLLLASGGASFVLSFRAMSDFAGIVFPWMRDQWQALLFPVLFDIGATIGSIGLFVVEDAEPKKVRRATRKQTKAEPKEWIGLAPGAKRLWNGATTTRNVEPARAVVEPTRRASESSSDASDGVAASPSASDSVASESSSEASDGVAASPSASEPVVTERHLAIARDAVTRTGVRVEAERVARSLAALDAGQAIRPASKAGPMHHTVLQKLVDDLRVSAAS